MKPRKTPKCYGSYYPAHPCTKCVFNKECKECKTDYVEEERSNEMVKPSLEGLTFEKVELKAPKSPSADDTVYLSDHTLTLGRGLTEQLGWRKDDRVDLLQNGKIFALERSPVGVFTLKHPGKTSQALRINSSGMARHIRATTHENCRMKGFIDKGRIIFMKEE